MTIKLLSKSKKSFNNSFIEVKEIINKTLLKIITALIVLSALGTFVNAEIYNMDGSRSDTEKKGCC